MAEQYIASDAAKLAFQDTDVTADVWAALNAATDVTIRELQAKIEDKGVRAARDNGWCGVFTRVMSDMFPNGPLDGIDWRDAAGVACDGSVWRDAEGYDRAGFDTSGYDRTGFHSTNDLDREGYNREGLDEDGFTRTDPEAYRFNADGYARDGFRNSNGAVYSYLTRELLAEWATSTEFKYNRAGFDIDGYNRHGYNRAGIDADGYNRDGRDTDGFDRAGWKHQLSANSRNTEYVHKSTGGRYTADGFDVYGAHKDTGSGYGPDGYSVSGFDRNGLRRPATASVTA